MTYLLKNNSHAFKLGLVAITTLALSGCARNISSDNYNARTIGEASFSYQGVVSSARQVDVSEGDYLEDNKMGMLLGGGAGGLAGSQIGSGRGAVAGAVGGAVLGAVAGAFAEKALKEQKGMEYVVRLNNGQMMTVVQGVDNPLAVGQRVIIMVKNEGRSRVIADNSPVQDVQPMIVQPHINAKITTANRH